MTQTQAVPEETQAAREPTSSRIVTEGAQLFREQGYAVSTTRELSARLGITKASLYYHVQNKEDLLYKICVESLTRVTEAVTTARDAEADPLTRVRAVLRAHLRSVLGDLDLHATMLFELRSLTGERRTEVQHLRDNYQALITAVIKDAQAAGALRTDLSAKHLTLGLLSLVNWAIAWFDTQGPMTPDDLAEVFWELYVNGAKAPR